MTPQEHAHELVAKFYGEICHLIPVEDGNERSERFRIIQPIAKNCALISVDEILSFIEDERNCFNWKTHYKKVKQQIEKL